MSKFPYDSRMAGPPLPLTIFHQQVLTVVKGHQFLNDWQR
jgi:hypothetical protein